MRNQLNQLIILTFLTIYFSGCQTKATESKQIPEAFQTLVDSIRMAYTPDQRVDKFRPDLEISDNNCLIIKGKTTNNNATKALISTAKLKHICIVDSLQTMPITDLGKDTFGVVNVSVANLRTTPKHSGELTTQVLMGMPLKLLDQRDNWFLVQSPAGYIAWLEAGAFVSKNAKEMNDFYQGSLAMITKPFIHLKNNAPDGSVVRDLSTGGIVKVIASAGNYQEVILPDGKSGFLPKNCTTTINELANNSEELRVGQLANQFYGAPYLWGGTSAKGMDCSGFTKMTYLVNGYVIPRDASQQVTAGEAISLDDSLSQIQPDDLLFFGNIRDDGSHRITHVGIYLGDGRFAHSGADNGFIREQSLLPSRPGYAPHRRESLLSVRRLNIGSPGVTPLKSILKQVYH